MSHAVIEHGDGLRGGEVVLATVSGWVWNGGTARIAAKAKAHCIESWITSKPGYSLRWSSIVTGWHLFYIELRSSEQTGGWMGVCRQLELDCAVAVKAEWVTSSLRY